MFEAGKIYKLKNIAHKSVCEYILVHSVKPFFASGCALIDYQYLNQDQILYGLMTDPNIWEEANAI